MAGPLTEDHKREIDRQLAALKEAGDLIRRAKLANIDVAAEEAQVEGLTKQLQAIKGAFFPTGK